MIVDVGCDVEGDAQMDGGAEEDGCGDSYCTWTLEIVKEEGEVEEWWFDKDLKLRQIGWMMKKYEPMRGKL